MLELLENIHLGLNFANMLSHWSCHRLLIAKANLQRQPPSPWPEMLLRCTASIDGRFHAKNHGSFSSQSFKSRPRLYASSLSSTNLSICSVCC